MCGWVGVWAVGFASTGESVWSANTHRMDGMGWMDSQVRIVHKDRSKLGGQEDRYIALSRNKEERQTQKKKKGKDNNKNTRAVFLGIPEEEEAQRWSTNTYAGGLLLPQENRSLLYDREGECCYPFCLRTIKS